MKKLLFLLSFILITTPLYAVEFSNGDFKANIYGEIYADGGTRTAFLQGEELLYDY